MGIKGNDVIDSHTDQFLKSQSTVQRFSPGPFVLTAFIKERHDHIDSSGFSSYGGNDPFQILEMIVRGHVIGVAAERVSQRIVADIHHKIRSSPRTDSSRMPFASPEPKRGVCAPIR